MTAQHSVLSESSVRTVDLASARNYWPIVTEEQKRQDMQQRLLQAAARRQADEALCQEGRLWITESRLSQEEASAETSCASEKERGQQYDEW